MTAVTTLRLGNPPRERPARNGRIDGVRRIAVLRTNGIGDLVFALPALEALRRGYPDAEITLLAARWAPALLADRPGPVDRVAVVPGPAARWPGVDTGGDRELDEFVAAHRRRGYDLAVQMHGGGRESNRVVRALGARVTAGLCTPDAPPLDRCVPYVYYQPEVLRFLELVAAVGCDEAPLSPRLAVTDSDRAASRGVVADTGAPLAVLHVGATDPRRRWPAGSFAQVGDALVAAGAEVAVIGTDAERAAVTSTVGAMREPAVALAGALSLPALVGLLSRAAVVVGNDSGPLHLAEAVGAPTVGVYWCGNLINAGPATRRRHRVVLSWRLRCPRCGVDCTRAECPHRDSFVADVAADEVVAEALALLVDAPPGYRRPGDGAEEPGEVSA